MRGSILVVDDDAQLRAVYEEILSSRGHQVTSAASAEEALAALHREPFDLVLTDVRMPGMSGHDLLDRIHDGFDDVVVIVLTGYGDVEGAVRAMRAGAYEYLTKPVVLDRLIQVVERGLVQRARNAGEDGRRRDDTARSQAMRQLQERLDRVAATDCSLLLVGEPGTGKETTARELHRRSSRAEGPFVRFECAALSLARAQKNLLGQEGGEAAARPGLLERASGGTLYLADVDAIPRQIQRSLYHALDSGQVIRIGGSEPRRVDVRVISATASDLGREMEDDRFRRDLFYRLAAVQLRLPPLRERAEDLPPLAQQLLGEACSRLKRAPRGLSPRALERLMSHAWPGNLRELRSVLEQAVVMSSRRIIRPRDLPLKGGDGESSPTPTIREMERRHIEAALQRTHGNKLKAAALLGISRVTLYRKLRKFGLM